MADAETWSIDYIPLTFTATAASQVGMAFYGPAVASDIIQRGHPYMTELRGVSPKEDVVREVA